MRCYGDLEKVMPLNVGGFFFFKQKTAYEMRISDWSSYVCSSDLGDRLRLYCSDLNFRRRRGGWRSLRASGNQQGHAHGSANRTFHDSNARHSTFPDEAAIGRDTDRNKGCIAP